jgi:hypothetical protein
VDTWRDPKALYSALWICSGSNLSAAALSRSMAMSTCEFLICRSLVTSWNPGIARTRSSTIGAQW